MKPIVTLLTLLIVCLVSPAFGAPQATNPDPFNVQRRAPVDQPQAQPQAPAPQSAPVVVNTQPPQVQTSSQDMREWAHTMLYTLLVMIAGWVGIKLPSKLGGGGNTMTQSKVTDIVASVLNPQDAGAILKGDPDLKAAVDVALLKAIQSGVPGKAIQTGFSLIPGAAPIIGVIEPIVRNVVLKVLEEKTGQKAAP